jgi:hypothetical protein
MNEKKLDVYNYLKQNGKTKICANKKIILYDNKKNFLI